MGLLSVVLGVVLAASLLVAPTSSTAGTAGKGGVRTLSDGTPPPPPQ